MIYNNKSSYEQKLKIKLEHKSSTKQERKNVCSETNLFLAFNFFYTCHMGFHFYYI